MKDLSFNTDPRFVDLGDLPSGFFIYPEVKPIYIRPFSISELSLLHRGRATANISHILRAMDLVVSCDIYDLTDGDIEFIAAWLRLNSYPETPLLVTWTCNKTNVVHKHDKSFYTGVVTTVLNMKLKGLEHEVCDTENKEIVRNNRTIIHSLEDDFSELPQLEGYPTIDFPRARTLVELEDFLEETPTHRDILNTARWIKEGTTLKDKYGILTDSDNKLFFHIKEVQEKYKIGISEEMLLSCRACTNTLPHKTRINLLTYFADNTQTSLLNIKYKLMTSMGVHVDDSMSSKEFLYLYSCILKDEQEERAKQSISKGKKATRG